MEYISKKVAAYGQFVLVYQLVHKKNDLKKTSLYSSFVRQMMLNNFSTFFVRRSHSTYIRRQLRTQCGRVMQNGDLLHLRRSFNIVSIRQIRFSHMKRFLSWLIYLCFTCAQYILRYQLLFVPLSKHYCEDFSGQYFLPTRQLIQIQ